MMTQVASNDDDNNNDNNNRNNRSINNVLGEFSPHCY